VVNRPLVVAGIVVLLAMLVLSIWAYVRLPADALVPTSWTFDGEVRRNAGKLAALFTPVALFPVIIGVLFLVPKIEPRKVNLARSATAFRATTYAVMGFFAALHVLLVGVAFGWGVDIERVVPLGVGALLLIIGNWLPKVRSNFFFGIRTPWTLTSDYTWRRTHRVGGWVFVVLGVVTMVVAALLPIGYLMTVILGGTVAAAAGLVVYSYIVWRDAPDRDSRAGTG
jgi:uncharacterized membrane protein